jgi:hypothetical protein
MGVERSRGRHDDDVHDRIRREHARDHVRAARVEFCMGCAATMCQIAAEGTLFFNFLRGLPEKQVRRDRRAKNRDQDGEEGARPFHMRKDRRL